MKIPTYKFGDTLQIKLLEEVQIDDSLSVTLNYFSHKHPMPNGPTKAMAYITISKDTISEEVVLAIHGIEGRTEIGYDTRYWNGYEFQLKEFNYDDSIKVIVVKKDKNDDE